MNKHELELIRMRHSGRITDHSPHCYTCEKPYPCDAVKVIIAFEEYMEKHPDE
jgi:hypothetical protein